ncbi:hypothetical protein HanIR_Chr13g0637741 [Helianthus annuus]|nr:hypothetical protein HanIR_Chr13g0637741 [Helianthus annuus]
MGPNLNPLPKSGDMKQIRHDQQHKRKLLSTHTNCVHVDVCLYLYLLLYLWKLGCLFRTGKRTIKVH